jgi:hypothetical protein
MTSSTVSTNRTSSKSRRSMRTARGRQSSAARHAGPTRTKGRRGIDFVWKRFQVRATSPSVPSPPGIAT